MENDSNVVEHSMFDSVFEHDFSFGNQSSGEITSQNAFSLQNAKDKIQSFTGDEFLIEAYNAATHLRNTLGDADGLVSELSETIRMNILVVAMTFKNKPAEMIMSLARTLDEYKQTDFIQDIIETLSSFKRSIESESLNDQ